MTILKGKTIAVSGAAGFIPSTLCEYYLNLGCRVIGFDNFITGSKENIEILKKFPNFSFHEHNIVNPLPSISEKIDFVFSLASPASPVDFELYPLEIMDTNSNGTKNMLELARIHKARVLIASTSEVYGDPEIHPQVESYVGHVNPIGPRACYDESKRFAEALIMSYRKVYNLETRIVRIFNTYGPRMRPNDGRVIPNMINQALKGEALTIYGDGSQTRSFCYVTDLVRAIDIVMNSNDHTPFNIGNPREFSIKQAAEVIIKALDSKSVISFLPLPKDDPKMRRPDLTKIKAISDYEPSVSFEEGLVLTAHYFKERL